MKKRIKYILIISFLLLLVFCVINAYMNAKDRSLETEKRDKEREAKRGTYVIKRESNLYTLTSDKLIGKTLKNSFYDGTAVYLLYTDNNSGTLLKYVVSTKEVIVIFENNPDLVGGIEKFYGYYKIGNKLYDANFEKFILEKDIGDGEYLLKGLNTSIYNKDDGIYTKNLDTNEEENILLNSDINKYSIYDVDHESGYVLIERESEGKKYILVYDDKLNETGEFLIEDKDKSFKLIDNGKYLLKKTKDSNLKDLYKIYDTSSTSNVYTSDADANNYLFMGTKFISNKDGNINLSDYLSGEERTLISKNNNKANWFPKEFTLADDSYSLFLRLDNNDRKFYLIYL